MFLYSPLIDQEKNTFMIKKQVYELLINKMTEGTNELFHYINFLGPSDIPVYSFSIGLALSKILYYACKIILRFLACLHFPNLIFN